MGLLVIWVLGRDTGRGRDVLMGVNIGLEIGVLMVVYVGVLFGIISSMHF